MNSKPGRLYLIPVFLSDTRPDKVFPDYNFAVIEKLRYFIAEHEKTARRFIKKVAPQVVQSELQFYILNKHTNPAEIGRFLQPLENGLDMGLLSDSGMPAVADPGAAVVRIAHKRGIKVVPLVGPSSVILALAASGLNGQHFEFHGYLPIDKGQLIHKIKKLAKDTLSSGKTQIFIETPYRNDKIFNFLLKHLPEDMSLCIAIDITGENEQIKTKTVSQWKRTPVKIGKIPAIFLFGR